MSMDILSNSPVQFTSDNGGNFSLNTDNDGYVFYQNYDFTAQSGFDNITSLTITGTNLVVDLDDLNFEAAVAAASAPSITTNPANNIAFSSATLNGNVTADGGAAVTARGFVYSTSDNTPTIGESAVTNVSDGSGTGIFSEAVTGLSPSTTYYYQAYATNSEGTSYGGVQSFGTADINCTIPPDQDFGDYEDLSYGSSVEYACIIYTGSDASVGIGNAVSQGISKSPEFSGSAVVMMGNSAGGYVGFKSSSGSNFKIVSLAGEFFGHSNGQTSQSYFVKGYRDGTEVNSVGFFTTSTEIYVGEGGEVYWERRNFNEEGSNSGMMSFGPTWNSIDEIRFYPNDASPNDNIFVGLDNINFEAAVPSVVTNAASDVTTTTATFNGNVTDDGGAAFTARGFVYSTSDNTPTISESGVTNVTDGSGTGIFSEAVTGLSPSTTYYYQAYATNSEGTSYGGVQSFATSAPAGPVASDVSTCSGSTVSLTATGQGAIKWYDAATGGNLLFEGATFVTPALTSNTNYYVEDESTVRTEVKVTIQFGSICGSIMNNVFTLKLPSAGTTISDIHSSLSGNTLTLTVANSQSSLLLASDAAGVTTDGTSTYTIDLGTFSAFGGISVVENTGTDLVTVGAGGLDFSIVPGGANQVISFNLNGSTDKLTVSDVIKTKGSGYLLLSSALGFDVGGALVTANTLSIITEGEVTQSASLSSGLLKLGKEGNTGTYTLTNAGNNTNILQAEFASVNYTDSDGVTIANSTISDNIQINAGGGEILVSQGGIRVASGTVDVKLTNTTGTITVQDSGIEVNGNITFVSEGQIISRSNGTRNTSGTGFISFTSKGGGITITDGAIQSKGAISLSAAGAIAINGTSSTNKDGVGDFSVITSSGSIAINDGGISSNGNLILEAPGSISIQAGGVNNSYGTGTIQITSTESTVSINHGGVSSKGDITIESNGTITTKGGSVRNSDGTGKISLTSSAGEILISEGGIRTNGLVELTASGLISIIHNGVDNSTGNDTNVLITSNAGSVEMTDIGVKSKGNVTVNANGNVIISRSGIQNATGSGAISVRSGSQIVVNSCTDCSGDFGLKSIGEITLEANAMNILGPVNSGSSAVNLKPASSDWTIELGGDDDAEILGLSGGELALISSGKLVIGDADHTYGIDVLDAISEISGFDISFISSPMAGGLDIKNSLEVNMANLSGLGSLLVRINNPMSINQLSVTESVELGAGLVPLNFHTLSPDVMLGDQFRLINNIGTEAIVGTFKDLPEGEVFEVRDWDNNKVFFKISYVGGDGNDVELTGSAALPEVFTSREESVGATSAVLGGNLISSNAGVSEVGIVWSTSPNPTRFDNKVVMQNQNDFFSKNVTGLPVETLIYVRAFATNEIGTGYGEEISFTTLSGLYDATLANLEVSQGVLDPEFTSEELYYSVFVNKEIESISVTPTASQESATITVNGTAVESGTASGAIALSPGENTISVEVMSQGSVYKSYTVKVIRGVDLLIQVNSKTKLVGNSDPEFTASFSTSRGEYDENKVSGTLVFDRVEGEDPGNYEITASGLASDYYNISYESGNLTILGPPSFLTEPTVLEIGYGEEYSYTAVASLEGDLLTSLTSPVLPSWLDFAVSENGNGYVFADLRERNGALGITSDEEGNIFASSGDGTTIYKITPQGDISVWADGLSSKVSISIAFDEQYLYLGSIESQNSLFRISRANPGAGEEVISTSVVLENILKVVPRGEFLYASTLEGSGEDPEFDLVRIHKQTGEVTSYFKEFPAFSFAFDEAGDMYIPLSPLLGANQTQENGVYKFAGGSAELVLPFPEDSFALAIDNAPDGSWFLSTFPGGIRNYTADFSSFRDLIELEAPVLFTMTVTPGGAVVFGPSENGFGPAAELFKLGNGGLLSGIPSKEDIGDHPVTLRASNEAGSTDQEFIIKVVDKTAPVVSEFTPAHESEGVALQPTLTITFDEEVVLAEEGIFKLEVIGEDFCSTVSILELDLSNPEVRALFILSEDKKSVSIKITENLPALTQVLVELPYAFVSDTSGNVFVGFSGSTYTWTFTTTKNEQTITFPEIEEKTYGDETFTLGDAETDQGLTVTYTAEDPSVVSIAGNQATILKVGSTKIRATQEGDEFTYAAEPVEQTLTVIKARLAITADKDQSKVFGSEDPEMFTYTASGFAYEDNESVLAGALSRASGEDVGSYAIGQGSLSAGDNYEIEYTGADFEITKKAVTITADDQQKTYGEANPTLTFTYTGLVNGDTKVTTEPSIATAATASSNVGNYPITLEGGEDQNYEITLVTGTLTIGKKELTITADDQQKTYGEANPTLTFTYAGLVNGDTKVTTEPSIATAATASSNVGSYPITLEGGADQNYAITLVNGTLTIGKKALTIRADNKQKTYGEANPALTFTYEGLVNGDTKVTTEPSIATAATASSNVGNYPITLEGGADQNYAITLVNGTLTIGKKDLTIRANDKQKTYGEANPALSFTYEGLVNGDTKVTTEPSIATAATASSNVGSYPITLEGGADQNYAITLVNGTLTIGQKALTITADEKFKIYGEANPTLTFSYAGLVNGDTKVTTEPSIATAATASSNAGSYPIVLEGGADQNYAIILVNGTLTIGQKELTITPDDKQKTYGEENPTLTFSYTGLVNGDTKVATEPSISTTATASSNVGSYPIMLEGGFDQNYTITLHEGELTIGQKALTIRADDKQKIYGEENPALSFTYEGLVNGDTKVATEPSIATTATQSSNVGAYPISLTGGEDQNYSITLEAGTLTINKAILTIVAEPKAKIFGAADPEFSYVATGFQGADGLSSLSGQLGRAAGEAVGVYALGLGTLKSSDNYQIEFVSAPFEIIPAELIAISNGDRITTPWSVMPVLPSKLKAVTADGQVVELAVSWNTTPLNLFKRGTYFLTGTLTLPSGILNPGNLTASQEVVVLPKAAPQDVTLSNNDFDADPKNYFQVIGSFTVIDPIDAIHTIRLKDGAGDNQYFEVKDGILFWSSAEAVEGRTEFTVVIQVLDRDGNMIEKSFRITRGRTDLLELKVFNTFTPNGDGINDTWGVPDMRYFRGARVQLFDRNGERIFYTEDADTRWDGTYKGKEMPAGSYFWIVEVRETGKVRRGILTILKK